MGCLPSHMAAPKTINANMNILFIHQNFPGQFKHLAPALAAMPGNTVRALTLAKIKSRQWQGVELFSYQLKRSSSKNIHPWLSDLEAKTIRGEACYFAALKMKEKGYYPDIIVAHPGWGESLFLKEVWPEANLGLYCEYFYNVKGADTGFDPEFEISDPGKACKLRMKNANNLLQFDLASLAISPTRWQASTFPTTFQEKISIIHDGIDTTNLKPVSDVKIRINDSKILDSSDEIVTFVNRNLEPTRGYHKFMRALPRLLKERPSAHILIIGGEGNSYGAKSKDGISWKQRFINEVRPKISDNDWLRVHFLGNLAYNQFVKVLQLSKVHVYLTYPFVLSWSLIEAMSIGCAIVASDTAPLWEVIEHEKTGLLVDFFDSDALVESIGRLLESEDDRSRLGSSARHCAVARYDLSTVCLPRQIRWIQQLASS